MAYLSLEEYKNYSLVPTEKRLSESLFEAFEIYAEVIINSFTFDAVEKYKLLEDEYYASKIKKAVAYQIDYMNDDEANNSDSSLSSFTKEGEKIVSSYSVTVGETSESISYDNNAINTNGNCIENRVSGGLRISPLAVPILTKVRALGRGIK